MGGCAFLKPADTGCGDCGELYYSQKSRSAQIQSVAISELERTLNGQSQRVILRTPDQSTRTHELAPPKPTGQSKVLTAEVMAAISSETAFCPAASCAQLQRFFDRRYSMHLSRVCAIDWIC
jgi:hypothetical protein